MKEFAAYTEKLAEQDVKSLVGIALAEALKKEPREAVLYADVGRRFGLEKFREMGGFCLDVGISEQNMIGAAAGICHEGLIPAVISYAPFAVGRAFDQIKANLGEMRLPVQIVGATSGFAGGDLGPLLICMDDVAMLRTIPGLTIVSPADGLETVKCFVAAAEAKIPVYIRLTGHGRLRALYREDYDFAFGKAVPLREGKRLLVISSGAVTANVLEAADRLAEEGAAPTVLNMHTVSPLDTGAIDRYMDHETVVTVEEHSVHGGLGGAVAEYLAGREKHPRLVRLGLQGGYPAADRYENLMERAGLSAGRLYETFRSLL